MSAKDIADEPRVYTISGGHWTGISCSCCNGVRAKRKPRQKPEPKQDDGK